MPKPHRECGHFSSTLVVLNLSISGSHPSPVETHVRIEKSKGPMQVGWGGFRSPQAGNFGSHFVLPLQWDGNGTTCVPTGMGMGWEVGLLSNM